MNLYEAMNRLKNGQATKTPQMCGYVKRVDVQKESGDTWKEKFEITFVERTDADNDSFTSYKFTHEVSNAGVETVTGPDHDLKIDNLLYRMMRRGDWEIYSTSDVETARTGTTSRW